MSARAMTQRTSSTGMRNHEQERRCAPDRQPGQRAGGQNCRQLHQQLHSRQNRRQNCNHRKNDAHPEPRRQHHASQNFEPRLRCSRGRRTLRRFYVGDPRQQSGKHGPLDWFSGPASGLGPATSLGVPAFSRCRPSPSEGCRHLCLVARVRGYFSPASTVRQRVPHHRQAARRACK